MRAKLVNESLNQRLYERKTNHYLHGIDFNVEGVAENLVKNYKEWLYAKDALRHYNFDVNNLQREGLEYTISMLIDWYVSRKSSNEFVDWSTQGSNSRDTIDLVIEKLQDMGII